MENVKVFIKANAWLLAAIVAIILVLYQFVDPAPPTEITVATGEEGGHYYELGEYLKNELAREGVTLNVVRTAGSAENMERLVDPEGDVSIAFVQSGMEQIFDPGETVLSSLGSLYYEPIWVFYREDIVLDSIRGLQGYRVAAGKAGSGTLAVARYLLAENGLLGDDGITLVEEGGDRAVELLQAGEIEAAFFTV